MTKQCTQEIEGLRPGIFQLFYLKNNWSEDVSVEEVNTIDFIEVEKHLERGDSVFITIKKPQKLVTHIKRSTKKDA